VALLLCDLDDTLVDRGRIFGQWVADFTRPYGVSDQDLAWIDALDDGGLTPRGDFFAGLVQRLRLPVPVPDLVDEWTNDFPRRYRCDPGVREGLRDARARGWSLGVVTNGDATVQGRGAGLRTVWLSRGRNWLHHDYRPDQQAPDPAAAIRQVLAVS
jgi:putative hydrolase of the HAD superfamily